MRKLAWERVRNIARNLLLREWGRAEVSAMLSSLASAYEAYLAPLPPEEKNVIVLALPGKVIRRRDIPHLLRSAAARGVIDPQTRMLLRVLAA